MEPERNIPINLFFDLEVVGAPFAPTLRDETLLPKKSCLSTDGSVRVLFFLTFSPALLVPTAVGMGQAKNTITH